MSDIMFLVLIVNVLVSIVWAYINSRKIRDLNIVVDYQRDMINEIRIKEMKERAAIYNAMRLPRRLIMSKKRLSERLAKEFEDKDYAHAYMDAHQSTRIATQIKVLREQRGLTQKQLAELAKMGQERISAIEDVDYDAWTISTLRKLAYAFDTTVQISFVPFSHGIKDIANFNREYLQVESREAERILNEEKQ